MRERIAASVLCAGLAVPAAAFAAEIHVPGDIRRLQDALDAARPGDTVVLDGGAHRGPFRLATAGVTLEGRGGRIRAPARRPASAPEAALEVRAHLATVRGLDFVGGGVNVVGDGVTVEGCRFLRCGSSRHHPSAVEVYGNRALVGKNLVLGSSRFLRGIRVAGDDAAVEDNVLYRIPRSAGIAVFGGRPRVSRNAVSTFRGTDGIEVQGNEAVLEQNEVEMRQGEWSGIFMDGDRAVLESNRIDGTSSRGPSVFVEGSDGVLAGNEVTASGATGLVVWGDRTRIEGNAVLGVPQPGDAAWFGHGIVVRGSANVLGHNTVDGAWGDGVRVVGGDGNGVDGCVVTGSGACGLLNATEGTAVTGSAFLGSATDVVNGGSFSLFEGNDYVSGCPDPTQIRVGVEPWDDFGTGDPTIFVGGD